MRTAIIQPYTFPYIGYFQLINAVDKFVFYDDVNFINRGWINRNKILADGKEYLFTIPCIKASQNKLINEVKVDSNSKKLSKLLTTVQNSYRKAPFFKQFYPIIEDVLNIEGKEPFISEVARHSIILTCEYLGIDIKFENSSEAHPETKGMSRSQRLIAICKKNDATTYLNPIGGNELYSKEEFRQDNIELLFLQSEKVEYDQIGGKFVPWLSIIDMVMFNEIERVKEYLSCYKLI